ncbi:hypothetical protein ESA_03460 [Cronobacter sakazakii ATCC BAA-894]|uniref:Uncharacterized protein n=1 Tax=Cronobacter sakazakii (strain ATCC BAA-894) TaxID=290339 RepID=A7MIV3_CROS8|nr:hypothetical protein ESA_03460 [Cronobacter sakazakii ATCC BAA-894]
MQPEGDTPVEDKKAQDEIRQRGAGYCKKQVFAKREQAQHLVSLFLLWGTGGHHAHRQAAAIHMPREQREKQRLHGEHGSLKDQPRQRIAKIKVSAHYQNHNQRLRHKGEMGEEQEEQRGESFHGFPANVKSEEPHSPERGSAQGIRRVSSAARGLSGRSWRSAAARR